MRNLDGVVSVSDMSQRARKRLPSPIFDAIEGGAGDERTIGLNRRAFDRIAWNPKPLVDVRKRNLATTILDTEMRAPVLLAPTGYQRMMHRDAELATARAAGALGLTYVLSTATAFQLEDVAEVSTSGKWFQLYVQPEWAATEKLIRRAHEAGFSALCLTVDTAMHGIRERDIRNQLTVPLRLTPRMVARFARRPRWAIDFLRGGVGKGLAKSQRIPMSAKDAGKVIARSGRTITMTDLRAVRELWPGKFVVKGVLRGDVCAELVGEGVDGFIVSNHGGRQLDSTPPTLDVLQEVRDSVGKDTAVLIDSGFRRGGDIVKALALGADGVLIGRPYLYGLAAAGEDGVKKVLEILLSEVETTLGLIGCPDIRNISEEFIRKVDVA